MFLWNVKVQTYRPLASMPQVIAVAREVHTDALYQNIGRFRRDETHCMFKYTVRGQGRFRNANGEYPVPAGSGFLTHICDPETAYYYPDDGTEPWEFIYICFESPTATAMVHEMTARFGPIYTLPMESTLLSGLHTWQRYDGQTRVLLPAEGAALTMDTLAALVASKEDEWHRSTGHYLVIRAQQMIQGRLNENLTATQVADELQVSREHLTRVFREQLGRTPYQYIVRQKMLYACRLLKETGLSVKEVSESTGCESQSLFTKRFKQHLRVTPSAFRQVGTTPIR